LLFLLFIVVSTSCLVNKAVHIVIQKQFFVGLKLLTFGQKINLSGISPAKHSRSGPNSVYVDMTRGDNAQGIFGAIGPFWGNGGWDESCGARVLCCEPRDLSATSQRPIFTKFGHET